MKNNIINFSIKKALKHGYEAFKMIADDCISKLVGEDKSLIKCALDLKANLISLKNHAFEYLDNIFKETEEK